MKKSIVTNVIIHSAPFVSIEGKEALDLALVCAAFDHSVQLIFMDCGVFHLIKAQDDKFIDDKNHDKQLKSLEYYDISSIYVDRWSLDENSLPLDDLIDGVQIIENSQLKQMCLQSNYTVNL